MIEIHGCDAGVLGSVVFRCMSVLIRQRLPKNALWWAVDENGKAHRFKGPSVVPHTKFWFIDEEEVPLFRYKGDWLDSLTAKPKR